jgi:Major Facilitator Superfamily
MATTSTMLDDDQGGSGENEKPTLSLWQMVNMSFGFLGIQYGFGLQQANMSPIYRYLGADESAIPGLWLAGPLTGLLLQPIIGALSDKSWSPRWGRRKPYVFVGAIVGSIAMVLMPNSSSVLMAACLMWLLDAGLNASMEPFRAFVGDMLNAKQRPTGFSIQSFMVGFGQTLANLMPFILPLIGISMAIASECDVVGLNVIPDSVRYPFYIGAFSILATVFWTMYTTKEYPPEDNVKHIARTYIVSEEKNIRFWHIGLALSAAVLGGILTIQRTYDGNIKDYTRVLALERWNEGAKSLQESVPNLANFEKLNMEFNSKGVSLEKITEFTKIIKCSGGDFAKWESSVSPFVSYSKGLASFVPSNDQSSTFLYEALRNGLLCGAILFGLLFLILKIGVFKEILASVSEMPPVMRQLWWVKFFTWIGLPLMWQYLSLACAKYAFDAASPDANKIGFEAGTKWGGLCFGMFSITCFMISIFIPAITKKIGSRRATHAMFLVIGALGFFSMLLSNDKMMYLVGMGIVGLAWGSIMSLPYLMLANAVSKDRMGVYIGIFNAFICIPQFIGMIIVPIIYKPILGNDPRNALILCGLCLVAAAISCFQVKEQLK